MKLGTVIATQEIEQMAGGDVTAEALDRGWIHEFAEGQYIYGAPWVRLLRKLQSAVLDRAAELGFEEWLFPRLIPREALDSFRLSQYAPELLVPAGIDADQVLDPVQCISLYQMLRGRELDISTTPIRIVETLGGGAAWGEPRGGRRTRRRGARCGVSSSPRQRAYSSGCAKCPHSTDRLPRG